MAPPLYLAQWEIIIFELYLEPTPKLLQVDLCPVKTELHSYYASFLS